MKVDQRFLATLCALLGACLAVTVWLLVLHWPASQPDFVALDLSSSGGAIDVADEAAPACMGSTTLRPRIIVAAADADALVKASADFLANGANDQETILMALAALPIEGGVVELSAGTFSLSKGVKIAWANCVTLRGSGWNTVLKLAESAELTPAGMIHVGDSRYVTIENMALDGNASKQSDGSQKYGYYTVRSDHLIVRNLYVANFPRYGIDPHEPTSHILIENNLVERNGFDANGFDGITLDGVKFGTVVNNLVHHNGRNGINIVSNSSNIIVVRNVSTENLGSGILIQNGSSDVTVVGNTLSENSKNGAFLKVTNNNILARNRIADNGGHGIEIVGLYNAIVSNSLEGNGQAANNTFADIQLKNDGQTFSMFNLVVANFVGRSGEAGTRCAVEEFSTGDTYNVIVGTLAQSPPPLAIRTRANHSIILMNQRISAETATSNMDADQSEQAANPCTS